MGRNLAVSICILLLFPLVQLFPQSGGLDPNRVIILVADASDSSTPGFLRVVKNAVRVELVKTGFSTADTQEKNGGENLAALLDRAEEEQAGHLILCTITRGSSDEIFFTFQWHIVENRTKAAEISKQSGINLSMDTVITNGTKELVSAAGITPERKTEPAEKPKEEKAVEQPQAAPEQKEEEKAEPEGNRFNLSVGFAPFLATGAGTKYFTLGLEPHFNIGFRLRKPGHSFYFGLYGGLNRFVAEGVILTAKNYLVPFGLETRMIIDGGRHINFYLSAGAGPSLFFLNSAALGLQFKIIPSVHTGIGLDLMFTKALGIALHLSYTFYFEGSIVLMGFSPGLRYIMRL